MACPLRLNVSATDTPDDWDVVGDGFTKLTAVQTFDKDASYIVSTGANTSQWYQLDNVPGGQDTNTTIHSIKVTACHKADDPDVDSELRIDLRIGDASVGANDHPSRCGYSCVTETFQLNPNVDPPVAFTWADINDVEIGVTAIGPGNTRVSKLHVDIICGAQYTDCPRCCCCCLCFRPTLRWTGIVFGNGFTPEIGSVEINVPFRGYYTFGGGGCWFFIDEDNYDLPLLLGSSTYSCGTGCTGTCDLYLNGASIVAGVTALPTCTDAHIQLLQVCTEPFPVGSNSVTWDVRAQPRLKCCEPHHLSISDSGSITIDGIGSCTALLTNCGQFEIECLDMVGDVSIGTDCLPLA